MTLFGDTTFTENTTSGVWSLKSDTLWLVADPRNAATPVLISNGVLTTYYGGFDSGGARDRHTRQ